MNSFKCIFLLLVIALPVRTDAMQVSNIDTLFESYPKTEVLVLGTFHFKDAGLDSYKPEYDVDIRSEKRQEELDRILSKLVAFKPEGVGLEFHLEQESSFNKKYEQYLNGDFDLPANEIYQLGFKIAGRSGLSRIYGIDADALYYSEFYVSQEEHESKEERYADSLNNYAPDTRTWYPTFEKMWQIEDKLKTEISLTDYYLYLNHPKTIQRSHGIYVVDSFKLGMGMEDDYFGADMKTAWYNRNLRILQNIYRMIEETQAKRILIIIGAGHLPILKHAIEASPELEFIEVSSVLSNK